MILAEFKNLSEEKMLDILDKYAEENFNEGETSACDFEYGRHSGAYIIGFVEFLASIND